jgi:hypothetical protein
MRLIALAMALLAAVPAAAVEDTARIGLREDGGKPLAALQLRWPQTIVIMQAPVTVLGTHSIEIRREIAPRVSLGGTYSLFARRTLPQRAFRPEADGDALAILFASRRHSGRSEAECRNPS